METLQRTANRGSVSTASYDIDNSVKLESDNSEFFQKSYSSASNRETWTYSTWVKRTELGSNSFLLDAYKNSNTFFILGFTDIDDLVFYDIIAGTDYGRRTTAVFRDTSAWYHIVFVSDTTNGTAGDRYRLYVNGVRVTDFDTDYGDPPSGYDGSVNDAIVHSIGYRTDATTYFNGYLAETVLVDGQALNPTDFGEVDSVSGIWKPIEITDTSYTWGTNGFWLKYDNASSMGANSAGTGGFSVQNVNQNDQSTDTPTNNFCTLNPLNTENNGGGNVEYTEGATKAKTLAADEPASGSMAITKGKWYFECKALSNSEIMAGWGVPNSWGTSTDNPGNDEYSFAVHPVGRVYYYGNSYIDFSPSVSFDTNDIISVAIDADNGFCYWAKNGTYMNSATPTSGATGTGGFNYIGGTTGANMKIVDGDFLVPAFRVNYYTNSGILLNFGGYTTISISSAATDENGYGTFEYAPPSGYYALCTKNLAEFG